MQKFCSLFHPLFQGCDQCLKLESANPVSTAIITLRNHPIQVFPNDRQPLTPSKKSRSLPNRAVSKNPYRSTIPASLRLRRFKRTYKIWHQNTPLRKFLVLCFVPAIQKDRHRNKKAPPLLHEGMERSNNRSTRSNVQLYPP